VVADYAQLQGTGNNTLFLKIINSPERVYDVKLQETTVNFVMKQL
jgi:hypothetical protein